jgi:hypothetical protein
MPLGNACGREGRAERALGLALISLHYHSPVKREMLFVSTKAGFGPGAAPLVLFGMQNRTLCPYLAARHRILIF